MGSKASSPKTQNIQSSSLESSSGLHFLEIHFPTLGAGLGLVIIGAIMLHLCLRHRRKNRRRPEPQATSQMMNPFHHPNFNASTTSQMINPFHHPNFSVSPFVPNIPMMPIARPATPRITCVDEDTGPSDNNTKRIKKPLSNV